MAGETINTASAYTQIISSAAVGTGAWSADSSALNSVLTTGNEKDYPLLDFQLLVTSETFTDGETIDLYRIPSDGTNEAVSPDDYTSGPPHYLGSFVVEAASAALYILNVSNIHNTDKFKVQNNSASSATFSMRVRSRTAKGI